jgi:hypothetical protein
MNKQSQLGKNDLSKGNGVNVEVAKAQYRKKQENDLKEQQRRQFLGPRIPLNASPPLRVVRAPSRNRR